MEESIFNKLNAINVSDKIEKKNDLSYLSWAWAWAEVKKLYDDVKYTVYECTNPSGYVCNYFTDGRTCWVKTGVSINGLEYIEELPVMDYKNRSILLENVTSFDVNKAIQRSLTKALGRHGLGLYIYAGEDLPESEADKEPKEPKKEAPKTQKQINREYIEEKKQQAIKERQRLEAECVQVGIDLSDERTKNWVLSRLKTSSGTEQIIDSFNLEIYNNLLGQLIELKKGTK